MKAKSNEAILPLFLCVFLTLSGFIFISPVQADFIRIRGTVVNVRQGPGTTYPILFQAEQGDEFPLRKTEGLWCLIQLEKGQEAWVFARLVDVEPGELPAGPAAPAETLASEPGKSIGQRAVKPAIYLALLLLFIYLLKNRRRIFHKASTKLMEVSGYQREEPFRYDDRQPRDDTWKL